MCKRVKSGGYVGSESSVIEGKLRNIDFLWFVFGVGGVEEGVQSTLTGLAAVGLAATILIFCIFFSFGMRGEETAFLVVN